MESDVGPVKEQLAQVFYIILRHLSVSFLSSLISITFTVQSLFDHIPVGVGSKGVIPTSGAPHTST